MHFKPDYGYDKEAILLKDIELIRKACHYTDMNTREELIRMKEESGMSWRHFAEYFAIPYRTMQDWQLGNRCMPGYLMRLMLYRHEIEKLVTLDENGFTPEERRELARRIAEINDGHVAQHSLYRMKYYTTPRSM